MNTETNVNLPLNNQMIIETCLKVFSVDKIHQHHALYLATELQDLSSKMFLYNSFEIAAGLFTVK